MRVFAIFTEKNAGLVRIWARSWQKRGYDPQLITRREIRDGGLLVAVKRRGDGILSELTEINFSKQPGKPDRAVRFGKQGWKTAPCVRFPDGTQEVEVLQCGRPLA